MAPLPRAALAATLALLLTACAQSASRAIPLSRPIDEASVQRCARSSIVMLGEVQRGWRVDSRDWNAWTRSLEFGEFSGWNEGGIRSRFSIDDDPPMITVRVKATGAWFHDVGSPLFADDLHDAMKACIERLRPASTEHG